MAYFFAQRARFKQIFFSVKKITLTNMKVDYISFGGVGFCIETSLVFGYIDTPFFTKEDLVKLNSQNKLVRAVQVPELEHKTRPRSKSEGHPSKNEEHHLLCVGVDSLIRFFRHRLKKVEKESTPGNDLKIKIPNLTRKLRILEVNSTNHRIISM